MLRVLQEDQIFSYNSVFHGYYYASDIQKMQIRVRVTNLKVGGGAIPLKVGEPILLLFMQGGMAIPLPSVVRALQIDDSQCDFTKQNCKACFWVVYAP